jgi:predicted transcriptional regulator of viral defense system
MAKFKKPVGMSDAQWEVLHAAQRGASRKTREVTLQRLYYAVSGMTENSIIRKVGKLVLGGFLEKVSRGLYRVTA